MEAQNLKSINYNGVKQSLERERKEQAEMISVIKLTSCNSNIEY